MQKPTSSLIQINQTSLTFMTKVYLWMSLGIILSGITAFFCAHYLPVLKIYLSYNPAVGDSFLIGLYALMAFQIVLVLGLSYWIKSMSVNTAICLYLVYIVTTGITLSIVFFAYTQQSIAWVFFLTAFAFIGLSAYGYFTKRDLSFLGTFCIMGLWGLIGISLFALFDHSIVTAKFQWVTGIAGILIFSGLTAFDTKRIKALGEAKTTTDLPLENAAIFGALLLYLDFINLFLKLLQIFGRRR
jgi:FtsH-binding integral membrane protein